jgi:predicted esterase
MADDLLEALETQTSPSPTTAVVWMHGLGADGYDFVDIVPVLRLPESLAVRFVFPHAPMQPVAINTGLRHPERLAGVMALSCYLPLAEQLAAEASAANRDVPIFMAHGTGDPLIPLARARRGHEILSGLDYGVEWHEYPMPHSVCDAEIRDIGAWLTRILA